MLDHKKLNVVGFDRIEIEVDLLSMDSNKLGQAISGVSYADDKDNLYLQVVDHVDGSIKKIKTMCITVRTDGSLCEGNMKDAEKDSVKYGIRVKNTQNNLEGKSAEKRMQVVLDIVTGRTVYDTTHNIYNLHDRNAAAELIDRVIRELEVSGIYLSDPITWELITAEINKTIAIDEPISEYEKSFDWLFEQLYKSEKFDRKIENKKRLKDSTESKTYNCKRRNESIKIYDKTAQIKDKMNIYLDENLIRFEVTWNRENLKKKFKRDNADITILSDIDLMNKNFFSVIDEIIAIAKDSLYEEIISLSSQFKKAGKKEIDRVYSNNASCIFDNVIFIAATQHYYKGCNNSNFSKNIKSSYKDFDKRLDHRVSKLMFIFSVLLEKESELIKLNKTLKQYL